MNQNEITVTLAKPVLPKDLKGWFFNWCANQALGDPAKSSLDKFAEVQTFTLTKIPEYDLDRLVKCMSTQTDL